MQFKHKTRRSRKNCSNFRVHLLRGWAHQDLFFFFNFEASNTGLTLVMNGKLREMSIICIRVFCNFRLLMIRASLFSSTNDDHVLVYFILFLHWFFIIYLFYKFFFSFASFNLSIFYLFHIYFSFSFFFTLSIFICSNLCFVFLFCFQGFFFDEFDWNLTKRLDKPKGRRKKTKKSTNCIMKRWKIDERSVKPHRQCWKRDDESPTTSEESVTVRCDDRLGAAAAGGVEDAADEDVCDAGIVSHGYPGNENGRATGRRRRAWRFLHGRSLLFLLLVFVFAVFPVFGSISVDDSQVNTSINPWTINKKIIF